MVERLVKKMNCIKCGNVVKESNGYCPHCGTYATVGNQNYNAKEDTVAFCQKCGTKSQGGRYCGQCGSLLSQGQFVESGIFGAFAGLNNHKSLQKWLQNIKETCTGGENVDVKKTAKHGAVFAVCMLVLTLVYILVGNTVWNLFTASTNSYENNPMLKDAKNYLLAILYGLEVNHKTDMQVSINFGIKMFPYLLGITLLFVAISYFIMKKVCAREKKCNMLELMIFSMVNSVAVSVCGFVIRSTDVVEKATEYEYTTETAKLTFYTGIPFLKSFFMVFGVTFLLLFLVNGIQSKKEEKNSTWLYAFRSNLLVIGATCACSVVLMLIIQLKTGRYNEDASLILEIIKTMIWSGIVGPVLGMSALYSLANGMGYQALLSFYGKELFGGAMGMTALEFKFANANASVNHGTWLGVTLWVFLLFLMVRIVLDVARILKHTNTNDRKETIITLGTYAGAFSLLVTFITVLTSSSFNLGFKIPWNMSGLEGYKALDGKELELYMGAGSAILVFFKMFFLVFLVSLLVFWLQDKKKEVVVPVILAKKKIIRLAAVGLLCVPSLLLLVTSKEKQENELVRYEQKLSEVTFSVQEQEWQNWLGKCGFDEGSVVAFESLVNELQSVLEQ